MLVYVTAVLSSLQCSGDEVKQFYQDNCCHAGDVLDTAIRCKQTSTGTSTRYVMGCSDAKTFLTAPHNCGQCQSPTSNDVCHNTQVMKTCVVGGGIGAYGALVGYRAGGGDLKDIVVFERGLDTSFYSAQAQERGGQYPSLTVTASNGPWPYACSSDHVGPCHADQHFDKIDWTTPHPWYNGQSGVPTPIGGLTHKGVTPVWFAEPYAFGGNAQFNGHLFFHGTDVETGMSVLEVEGLRAVANNIGFLDGDATCLSSPGCRGIWDAFHVLSEKYGARVHGAATFFSTETFARIDLQRQARDKLKAQYRTGVNVASISKSGSESSSFVLKDASGAEVAQCENVILSAGAYATPKLFQTNFPSACPDAGKYLMNHYGIINAGTYYHAEAFTKGTSIAPQSGDFNAFPYFVPPNNNSHTIVMCSATSDGIGTQCYVITYGALQNDAQYASSYWNNVTSSGDIHYRYTPDPESTADHLSGGSAAIDAMEAYFQSLGAMPGTFITVAPDLSFQGKKLNGAYQTVNVSDVSDVVSKAMTASECKASIQDRIDNGMGVGIYHEMGTMSACLSSTTTNEASGSPGVYVGDASASKTGIVGSTAALSAYHGYKAGKATAAL